MILKFKHKKNNYNLEFFNPRNNNFQLRKHIIKHLILKYNQEWSDDAHIKNHEVEKFKLFLEKKACIIYCRYLKRAPIRSNRFCKNCINEKVCAEKIKYLQDFYEKKCISIINAENRYCQRHNSGYRHLHYRQKQYLYNLADTIVFLNDSRAVIIAQKMGRMLYEIRTLYRNNANIFGLNNLKITIMDESLKAEQLKVPATKVLYCIKKNWNHE